ncbi:phosphatidylcholine:ceramide cholinephosphotransferase 2 [Angomonas deanei]|nr:phosphatidylcholine:ceramide cholinephosphotransferase 2 [Angomonas deanei]|eukprot:EPY42803.1 phosphatidylcholine:ceramide cholinephosphotransferase 2 [Angomonas deanei]
MPRDMDQLPDIMFDFFPKVASVESGTDIVIAILNISVIIVTFKVFLLERKERGCADLRVPFEVKYVSPFLNKVLFHVFDSGVRPFSLKSAYLVAAIRFLTVYMCMMFYRTFCITMTTYPATDNHCQNPLEVDSALKNIFLTVVTLGSGAIHCGDLMFSGHTIILTIATCLLWEYGVFVHRFFFRIYGPVLLLISFYCIIASRSHYTDDILVSFHGTLMTFMLLHHSPTGARWQLQLFVRWWPCPGKSSSSVTTEATEGESTEVVITRD